MKNKERRKEQEKKESFAERREKALANADRQLKDIEQGREPSRRLRVGDVFMQGDVKMVVFFANDSRAAVAPLNSAIQARKLEGDDFYKFNCKYDVQDISPNSLVEVIESLGRDGLARHLSERGETISKNRSIMSKNAAKAKKDKGESTGKLGGYKGHSITSVIRAFGAAGWNLDEARAFFKAQKIDVADNTIKIQIRKGANGEEGAALSKKELAEIKPVVAKKEKSKDKKADKKKAKKSKPADDEDEEAEAEEDEAPAKKSKKSAKKDDEDEGEEEAEEEAEEEEEGEDDGE